MSVEITILLLGVAFLVVVYRQLARDVRASRVVRDPVLGTDQYTSERAARLAAIKNTGGSHGVRP